MTSLSVRTLRLAGLASLALLILTSLSGAMPGRLYAATLRAGTWQRLFAQDIERMIGRAVFIDKASVITSGTTRTYLEADMLTSDKGKLARGSILYAHRTVNCRTGASVMKSWSIVSPKGTLLGTGTSASGTASALQGDSVQGKILGYVCKGILPR